jgi:hypothetical protein
VGAVLGDTLFVECHVHPSVFMYLRYLHEGVAAFMNVLRFRWTAKSDADQGSVIGVGRV